MKLPNFTRPLYGVGEIQTFFIFFSKLTYGPLGFTRKTSPTFDKLYEIE